MLDLKSQEMLIRDLQAHRYDAFYAEKGRFWNRAEFEQVMARLALARDHVVLDAGCGTGRFAVPIAARVARVTAVDFSSASLAVLREKAARADLANIECVASDLARLEIAPRSFDRIVSVQVLQHVPSRDERVDVMRRFARALRPGGRFVSVWYRLDGVFHAEREGAFAGPEGLRLYHRAFAPDELQSELRDSGYARVHVAGLLNCGRAMRLLPGWAWRLDEAIARTPLSKRLGRFLLAVAEADRR